MKVFTEKISVILKKFKEFYESKILKRTQSAFTCSKLTIEALERGVTYFTSCSSISIFNFEQVITDWDESKILKRKPGS